MTISNKIKNKHSEANFKIINLKYEYPEYKGDVYWAIVSELSEEELLSKYPDEIQKYVPFIRLSISQGEVFEEGTRYENKCRMRAIRYQHGFDITDDDFENYHHELLSDNLEDEIIRREEATQLQFALSHLKKLQRERLYKHFFCQMSCLEIAKEEGVSHTAVKLSIESAKKNLRKFCKYTFK